MVGLMLRLVVPVFVTETTVCVTVLLTRLFPKSKNVVLSVAEAGAGSGWPIIKVELVEDESDPDVPVTVIVAVPGVVLEDAVREICWSVPGVSEREDGDAETPVGRELIDTDTGLENPFMGTAEIVISCAEPPGVMEI